MRITVETLAGGGIIEQLNASIHEAMENITDPNKNEGKNKVILEIEIKPSETGEVVDIKSTVKTKLQGQNPISAMANIGKNAQGETHTSEWRRQRPLFDEGEDVINMEDHKKEEK